MGNIVSTEAAEMIDGASGTQVTVASVTTSSGSPSATVASGGFPNASVGDLISGTGIASGTQVKAIVGNTLTLSQNATASGTVTLTFWRGGFPVGPAQVALTTSLGSATAAGTEVAGGSYARQNVSLALATWGGSNATASSSGDLTYTNMPACLTGGTGPVVGVDEYDSATTPVRRWTGALAASKQVNAGDTFTITTGNYTKTLG